MTLCLVSMRELTTLHL